MRISDWSSDVCSSDLIAALGLAGADADRGDLVAHAPEDLELETVEGEDLADVGDAARLVQDEAGDGGGLLVRQAPLEAAVEVAQGHLAVDDQRPVALKLDALDLPVVLVGDVADDLLQNVLERDDATP